FLKQQGLTLGDRAANRLIVDTTGTVAQIEQAFHITINNYRGTDGKVHFGNATSPQLPATIANLSAGIVGLSDENSFHTNISGVKPLVGTNAGAYSPKT